MRSITVLFALAARLHSDPRVSKKPSILDEEGLRVCVVPSTVDIPEDASCSSLRGRAELSLDIMLGEAEHVQLVVESRGGLAGHVSLSFPSLPAAGPATVMRQSAEPSPTVAFDWRQLGYVHCDKTPRYDVSATGFFPDPLLPAEDCLLQDKAALWVTATVPTLSPQMVNAARLDSADLWIADHKTQVEVAVGGERVQVPLRLRVWPIALPDNIQAKVTQYWNYRGLNAPSEALYDEEGKSFDAISQAFHTVLAENRVPATDFEFGDERSWRHSAEHTPFVSLRLPFEPKCRPTVAGHHGADAQSPGYSKGVDTDKAEQRLAKQAADIEKMMSQFAPLATRAEAFLSQYNADHADQPPRQLSVYVYDEVEQNCLPTLRSALGALKKQWPSLVIVAPLNWRVPHDLDLDIQAMKYDEYVGATRSHGEARVAAGKRMWLYHCVEPRGRQYMNTFIESPLAGSRLLFWLAATQPEISGWLYWSAASWQSCPNGRLKAHPHKTYAERVGTSAKISFDPGQYWVCNDEAWSNTTWTNGDGFVVYPAAAGPMETTRLHVIRDGIEDLELFRALPDPAAFASKLVQGPTAWSGPAGPSFDSIAEVRHSALVAAARALPAPVAAAPAARQHDIALTGALTGASVAITSAAALTAAENAATKSFGAQIYQKVLGALAVGGAIENTG